MVFIAPFKELKFSFKILLTPFINYQPGTERGERRPSDAGLKKDLVVSGWRLSGSGL